MPLLENMSPTEIETLTLTYSGWHRFDLYLFCLQIVSLSPSFDSFANIAQNTKHSRQPCSPNRNPFPNYDIVSENHFKAIQTQGKLKPTRFQDLLHTHQQNAKTPFQDPRNRQPHLLPSSNPNTNPKHMPRHKSNRKQPLLRHHSKNYHSARRTPRPIPESHLVKAWKLRVSR